VIARENDMDSRRAVHVVVFDGFADWEPAHALAELRRWGKRVVRTVGFTSASVVSMGGLRVSPDTSLDAVAVNDVELLILPGGDIWEQANYPRECLDPLLAALVAAEIPVAAICAGTLALGRAGVLDSRRHTSNASDYLTTHASAYAGASCYVDRPAVRDRHVITASGLAPVDFAREVFAELQIFNAADEELWYTMFKEGRLPGSSVPTRAAL
jgi:putative intracellular protease/amidase